MDIKGDWKKRAISGLMVLAMALSLLPTSILAADTRSVTENAIKNGSFEEPAFHDKNSPQWPANNVPDWDTTASDHLIEFGSTRKDGTVPHIVGKPNLQDSGCQFAELNADEESTLYQYAETVGGNVYEWGLSHRGRDGVDQMAVIIGPKQDDDPDKPSADGKDQFMRMTDWVRQHASEMGVTVYGTGCTQKITVYSKKFAKKGGFQNDIGDAFSASPSDVYTEKWNVWIIGTSNTAWGNYGTKSSAYAAGNLAYSCRYAVPDGQAKTVFAFCSYSAATYNKTLGNLIDNIHFSLYQTITAAAINNYVRTKLLPEPRKKRYYRIHIAYLIMICTLKQSLRLSMLQTLLPGDLAEEDVKKAYAAFALCHQRCAKYFIEQVRLTAAAMFDREVTTELNVRDTPEMIVSAAILSGFTNLFAEKLMLLEGKTLADGGSIEVRK